jgi:SAM-dependent methyltransferase
MPEQAWQETCPECKVHKGHKSWCSLQHQENLPANSGPLAAAGDYSLANYRRFLEAKRRLSHDFGFEVDPSEINAWFKPHQRVCIQWMVRGGRRALFAAFGLGKTGIQLEVLRLILKHKGGRGLVVCPLGVREEFLETAKILGIPVTFVRTLAECQATGIYVTNYESVREGKIDPAQFQAITLDEAAILRGQGGVKTFRELMRTCETVPYRFVATATPDPNEYLELGSYSAWLGIMTVSEMKTRFFRRDSTKADNLTLHPHKVGEFRIWTASWALFLNKPSDLGEEFSDEGYTVPPLEVVYHEIPVDHSDARPERDGQGRMFREAMHGIVDASIEKRHTLTARIAKMKEILEAEPSEHFILWHDLEDERRAIQKAVPSAVALYGAQRANEEGRQEIEAALTGFARGTIQYVAAKEEMFGSGVNWQYHCHNAIYCGITYKFADFIQSIHRIHRYLQPKTVRIHVIYAESEKRILEVLLQKWEQYKEQSAKMSEIIREFGLSQISLAAALGRTIGVDRQSVSRSHYQVIYNDAVEEMHEESGRMKAGGVGLIVTSIPFSTMYEYSASYSDFGHSDSNEHFWRQMDFAIPQMLRVLEPGRLCVCHVKDRIVPGGITGLGFQTVYWFHMDCARAFVKHGFAYIGMKTVVTDVVRENNQTYRLGWTEQCKDGSKMGVGMPEYLLYFRKPPTDSSNAYADLPVVKNKRDYSRSRWQIDAHGYARSSGNRLLTGADFHGLPHDQIFKAFRRFSYTTVYSYEHHVALSESLERCRECGHLHIGRRRCGQGDCACTVNGGILPTTFMLLQPQSWQPDVWTDVARMRTLNTTQALRGKEQHLCPLPLDLGKRLINQLSNPGEVVFDPFCGIGSVPMLAVQLGRKGIGIDLNFQYYSDAVGYCEAAERNLNAPTLFDLYEIEEGENAIPAEEELAAAEEGE